MPESPLVQPLSPEPVPVSQDIDIVAEWSPEQLADFSVKTKGEFDPKTWAKNNPDRLQDPGTEAKIADAHALLVSRGIRGFWQDLDTKKAAVNLLKTIPSMAKWTGRALSLVGPAIGEATGAAVEGLGGDMDAVREAVGRPTSGSVERKAIDADVSKRSAELVASTELGVTGLFELGKKAARGAGRALGILKEPLEMDPEERKAMLWGAVGEAKYMDKVAEGHGGATSAVLGGAIKELEAKGHKIDPQVVSEMSAGDPVTFLAFPGGFKVLTASGKVVANVASRAMAVNLVTDLRAAQRAAAAAVKTEGQAIATFDAVKKAAGTSPLGAPALTEASSAANVASQEAAGALARQEAAALAVEGSTRAQLAMKAGEAAQKVVQPISRGVSRVKEAAGDISDRVVDVALGIAPAAVAATTRTAAAVGEFAAGFMPPMVTPRNVRRGYELAGQIGQQQTGVAKQLLTGATQTYSPALRLVSDIAKGAPDVAAGAAKGYLMFDIPLAAVTSETPADTAAMPMFGSFFGAMGAVPRAGARVVQGQAIAPRAWGSKAPLRDYGSFPALDKANAFALSLQADPAVNQRLSALREFIKPTGAEMYLLDASKPDPATGRTQFEDAIRRFLPGLTDAEYTERGLQQGLAIPRARAADGTTRNLLLVKELAAAPHEAIHPFQDVLGKDAMRKINDLVYNEYAPFWDLIGQHYVEQFLSNGSKEFAERYANNGLSWQDAIADINLGSEWRKNADKTEIDARADEYVANELSAEIGDAILKHTGPSLLQNQSLPGKLARILGKTLVGFGVEPFQGVTTEGQNLPLRMGTVEGVREALRTGIQELTIEQRRPDILGGDSLATPRPPTTPRTPAAPETPRTTEEAAAAAEKVASDLPDTRPPVIPGGRTPKQILTDVAAAIRGRGGLVVDYRHAPGDPAAAPAVSREARRAIIEFHRTAPEEVRSLFASLFFPDRVLPTGKGVQVQGWSPEVFASNAQKLAKALDTAGRIDLSPYEIVDGAFTPDAWREIYSDLGVFVQNQMGGATGAGEPLVVPADVTGRGFSAPPVEGKPAALDQNRADIINALFGIKLPSTSRIGTVFPRNLAGQRVSAATKPGRVSSPVEPREPFSGKKAESLGIVGEEIKEVNPFRQGMDEAGIKPDFVEAIQHLNLDRIAEVSPAPEGTQEFRAKEFTLQAGFQPKALTEEIQAIRDKTAKDFQEERSRQYGITEQARDLGQKATTPEDIQALLSAREEYVEQMKSLLARVKEAPASEKGALLGEAPMIGAKGQLFREAYETATNSGSMAEGTRAKFQPKTQAGKDIVERGYELEESTDPETGNRFLHFRKKGDYTVSGEGGDLQYFVIPGTKSAGVGMVFVPTEIRGKGHATALYREMLTRLQEQGIETLEGDAISKGPIRIRENLLGAPRIRAIIGADNIVGVSNRVPAVGEVSFQPSDNPRAIISAAVKDAEGKIWPGSYHGSAIDAALLGKAKKISGYSDPDWDVPYEVGYLTGDGEFLSRSEAYDRGVELNQINPDVIPGKDVHSADFKRGGAQFSPATTRREQIGTGLPEIQKVAEEYFESIGRGGERIAVNRPLKKELMTQMADFYETAKHDPENPKVKEAYQALIEETLDQWDAIALSGISIEPWTKPGQPYKDIGEAMKDLKDNKRIYFFLTERGQSLMPGHPMLEPSGIRVGDRDLLVNDVFRAVHDVFGHAKDGFEFGPRGEFNAFLTHADMYSPEARPALAAETTAQNSWMYFGKHWEKNKTPFPERPFAPQKATTVPSNLIEALFSATASAAADVSERRRPLGNAPTLGAVASDAAVFQARRKDDQPRILGQTTTLGAVAADTASRNKFTDEAFPEAIEAVRTGNADGATFTADGKVWEAPKSPVDIVSLASVNVPRNELTADKVREAVIPYSALLDHPDVVAGVFAFNPSPDSTASIDINAVVPQTYRANTMKFAKANDQISIWDAAKFEEVKTGGSGDTVLKTVPEIEAILDDLTGGRPVKFSPRKKETDYSKYNTPASEKNLPATIWVLPNGVKKAIDGIFHESDLSTNAKDYDKRFGTDFQNMDVDQARLSALNAGFVRVRYNSKDGSLRIEANVDKWDGQRKGVLDHVIDHEADIDRLFIGLLDREGNIADQVSRNIFQELDKEKAIRDVFGAVKVTAVASPKGPSAIAVARSFPDAQYQPKTPETLPGLDLPKPLLSPAARATMSLADLRKMFPEAAIPRAIGEAVPSAIVESPLYKRAGSESAAVDAFAKRLVDFARTYESDPSFQSGLKWYSDFTPLLKKEFGKDADLFAELLAATSPNTNPEVNFGYAFDALQSLRAGRFDKIVPKFEEGLEKIADESWESYYQKELKAGKIVEPPANPSPATFLAHWIDKFDLKPKQSNGKLYGQHSLPVLQVFARRWMELNAGPKTRNFVENLLGKSDEATIDIWADRTMRWAGYEGLQDRWRILPENKASVSDDDFAFAQKTFRRAAEELKVTPSALQGALWFAEKKRWSENGWGRLDLGNFQGEMEKIPMLKSGFRQRVKTTDATKKTKSREQSELLIEPRYK